MKKLFYLLLATQILSFNVEGQSLESQPTEVVQVIYTGNKTFDALEKMSLLPDKIFEAVSSSDINKTVNLLQNTLINQEFKSKLIKEAQKAVEYYEGASSSLFLSPKDSINFILSGLTIAACYKAAIYCFKEHKPFELSLLVPQTLNLILKQIEAEIANSKPENLLNVVKNVLFNSDNKQTIEAQKLANEEKLKAAWLAVEKKKLIYITSIIIATQIALYSSYKMMSSLNCSSASQKLKDAQEICLLVNSWPTIQS